MQSHQEVYNGKSGFQLWEVLYTLFLWLAISVFFTNRFDNFGFNQVGLAVAPIAIAIFWYTRRYIKHTAIFVNERRILLERSGKNRKEIKWAEVNNAQLTPNGKELNLFDQSGALRLKLPYFIEGLEKLRDSVVKHISEHQQNNLPKAYFQQRGISTGGFVSFIIGAALFFLIIAIEEYSSTGSLDNFVARATIFLIWPLLLSVLLFFKLWRSPKQLSFLSDKLEIRTAFRRFYIPYSEIITAELVPNPWAPASSNRCFLKIHRNSFFKSYTVRGFELDSEQLLQRVQQSTIQAGH